MTRLASIMGVATVATLVLLSGCDTTMKTDHAKDLQGTWKVTIDRQVAPDPATPTVTFPVTTTVTAKVTRTGTNKGTVALAIVDVPPLPTAPAGIDVTGDIAVTDTKITVTSVMVNPMALLTATPAAAQLLAAGLTLEWDLSDDKLTVENETLFSTVLMLGTASLELAKQAGDDSSS